MHHRIMKILCDIGGTYARFALYDGEHVTNIRKYSSNEYNTFLEALLRFKLDAVIDASPALYIAMAGAPNAQGQWQCTNKKEWIISESAMRKSGWDVSLIMNDFEAAAWVLGDLDPSARVTLQSGEKNENALCLIGPGTGLGLAYYRYGTVQKTHGGHMVATAVTEEQHDIIKKIYRHHQAPIVFEHLVSGPGLVNIYNALSEEAYITHAAEVLEDAKSEQGQSTLRLFHEFLGLFAHTVTVTGHAYGGLYLTGGMIGRLCEHGLFNADQFIKHFLLRGIESVKESVRSTPIHIITDPNPALAGLKYLIEQNS